MIKNIVSIAILLSLLVTACAVEPRDQFRTIEQKHDLLLGVAAVSLTTGREVYHNADTIFSIASLIKTPILVEVFRQYEEGLLEPGKMLTVDTSNTYRGSGILQHMTKPYSVTLHDAAILMIILSDNTATNLVFEQLGPGHGACLDSVNTTMRRLGFPMTEMVNKPFGYDTIQNTPFARRYGIGASTPREMMTLMRMLARGEVISESASEEMIDIHKKQQYDDLVPRYLPVFEDTLSFAHKTGAISRARCDAGLIFAPGDTIAYAVMVDRVDDPRWVFDHKGNLGVAEAAKVMYGMIKRGE
jgi:beta-lactamase class A